jgi:hypothetical protein
MKKPLRECNKIPLRISKDVWGYKMMATKTEMQQLMEIGAKKCLVCYADSGKIRNDTLYWHESDSGNGIGYWCWCNRCERAYTMEEYCAISGISLLEFIKQDFNFKEAAPNEVQKIAWPKSFVPLYHKDAEPGVEYLKSRNIDLDDNIFYDTWRKGVVFPYYFDDVFCGAQIRLIEPWTDEEGVTRKIDTIPGTRLGLLFYNWNQQSFRTPIKGIVVCEGAFNALTIQQALNAVYGSSIKNPWKCVACSGSGASKHHLETLGELKDQGVKIVVAPDSDDAGMAMMKKFIEAKVATHYVLTNDDTKDWNDVGQTMGKVEYAQWFIGNIKKV